jgi:hypothetical protein
MRQGQSSKRSRGRSNNSGRRNTSPRNNNFDSNGPSVRIRGSATQVYEKYLQLARDAMAASDRVMAENLFQHAEHYLRILNADREESQANREQASRDQAPNDQPSRDGNGEGARENNARQQSNNATRRPPREARQPEAASPPLAQESNAEDDRDPKDQLPQFLVRDDVREKAPPRRRVRRPRVAAEQNTQPVKDETSSVDVPSDDAPMAEAEVIEATVVEVVVETPEIVQPENEAIVEDATRAAGD